MSSYFARTSATSTAMFNTSIHAKAHEVSIEERILLAIRTPTSANAIEELLVKLSQARGHVAWNINEVLYTAPSSSSRLYQNQQQQQQQQQNNSSNDKSGLLFHLPLTMMQQAAYFGSVSAATCLLRNGADYVTRIDSPSHEFHGLSCVELANQRGHYAVSSLIERHAVATASTCPTSTSMMVEQINTDMASSNTSCESFSQDSASPTTTRSSSPEPRGSPSSSFGDDSSRYLHEMGVGSNDGYKKPTEDRMVTMHMGHDIMLYAVFDGHCGRHYADQVSKLLPEKIKEELDRLYAAAASAHGHDDDMEWEGVRPSQIAAMLRSAFVAIDAHLMAQAERNFMLRVGGSTAVVSLVTPTHVISANLGDSPACIMDASTGRMLCSTDDHSPLNDEERRRIQHLGGKVVIGAEFGDLRVLSQRGNLAVSRAFGQYEFKQGKAPEDQIVTCIPQTYIWNMRSIREAAGPQARLFLSLFSDSFTEALGDHRGGALMDGGRPVQIIGNFLEHSDACFMISDVLSKHAFKPREAAPILANLQANKFLFCGNYHGDNTSILLSSLC